MASVALHAWEQLNAEGKVKLFVGSGGYGDGEQRRDFVYVDDVVAVNLWLLERRGVSGVFNCGTGRAQSFNELATAAVNAAKGTRLSTKELVAQGLIAYIPFPPQLVGKYQSFTQADLARLRAAGYGAEFMTVEQGVGAYRKEIDAERTRK
jgi:ADP-L-glycero-D-manno-heptose 6-epimerase